LRLTKTRPLGPRIPSLMVIASSVMAWTFPAATPRRRSAITWSQFGFLARLTIALSSTGKRASASLHCPANASYVAADSVLPLTPSGRPESVAARVVRHRRDSTQRRQS
jgi:hypothetical protein